MAAWTEITQTEDWNRVFNDSEQHPVLVFKHSTTCPISANAWKEFNLYLDGSPNEQTEYVMVKVIESRNLSNRIADDLQVVHKSPQVILMRDKQAAWDTSHWNITAQSLREALE